MNIGSFMMILDVSKVAKVSLNVRNGELEIMNYCIAVSRFGIDK